MQPVRNRWGRGEFTSSRSWLDSTAQLSNFWLYVRLKHTELYTPFSDLPSILLTCFRPCIISEIKKLVKIHLDCELSLPISMARRASYTTIREEILISALWRGFYTISRAPHSHSCVRHANINNFLFLLSFLIRVTDVAKKEGPLVV